MHDIYLILLMDYNLPKSYCIAPRSTGREVSLEVEMGMNCSFGGFCWFVFLPNSFWLFPTLPLPVACTQRQCPEEVEKGSQSAVSEWVPPQGGGARNCQTPNWSRNSFISYKLPWLEMSNTLVDLYKRMLAIVFLPVTFLYILYIYYKHFLYLLLGEMNKTNNLNITFGGKFIIYSMCMHRPLAYCTLCFVQGFWTF